MINQTQSLTQIQNDPYERDTLYVQEKSYWSEFQCVNSPIQLLKQNKKCVFGLNIEFNVNSNLIVYCDPNIIFITYLPTLFPLQKE